MSAEAGAALLVEGVSVHFGGVRALSDVDVHVQGGEVHGVIGPNGSGKTTLLNAVSGFVRGTGRVSLDGRDISRAAAHRRARAGLGRSFQNPGVDSSLTVADFLRCGEHLRVTQPWWMVAFAPLLADRGARESTRRAVEFLERADLDPVILGSPLTDLSAGVLKLVDVGRVLLGAPRILLLDEPTSGMNEDEILKLAGMVRGLKSSGATVVIVDHNLTFIRELCREVTFMAGGRVVERGNIDRVLAEPRVIETFLGSRSLVHTVGQDDTIGTDDE